MTCQVQDSEGLSAVELIAAHGLEALPQAVAALAEQLGFAAVNLGKLAEGGALVQAREDKSWGPLIFQDLFKNEA